MTKLFIPFTQLFFRLAHRDHVQISEASQKVLAAGKMTDLVQAVLEHVHYHEAELEELKDSEFYKCAPVKNIQSVALDAFLHYNGSQSVSKA